MISEQSNVLKAILTIAGNPCFDLKEKYSGRNTINNIGQALECYIKEVFSDTTQEVDPIQKNKKQSIIFSYIGNPNNPPDLILKGGDAIEVKKIQNRGAPIALNSSFPKQRLHVDDPKITEACKNCESFEEKGIIYAIGLINDERLLHLSFIYGDVYAASSAIYSRIGKKISEGILEIPDIEFSETKELGRVNRVDPLGITNLRIRGMWHIENPLKVFEEVYTADLSNSFNFTCLMKKEKFDSFSFEDRRAIKACDNVKLDDIKVKNPDNPAQLLEAKIITLGVK